MLTLVQTLKKDQRIIKVQIQLSSYYLYFTIRLKIALLRKIKLITALYPFSSTTYNFTNMIEISTCRSQSTTLWTSIDSSAIEIIKDQKRKQKEV